jgi:guanylate kinase
MVGIARRGLMLVLSSPSGAGKTTIARRLLELETGIEPSISYTTRHKRNGEKEGRDYHFVDREAFARMRDEGAFLEWAEVFDHYYGTPRAPVERALKEGRDVLFDVDWQGAKTLREEVSDDMVSVFILPPSMRALEKRLHDRAEDSDAVVQRRMRGASEDIRHWIEYDYVVINRDVAHSVEAVRAILAAERLRRSRLIGLKGFVYTLLSTP